MNALTMGNRTMTWRCRACGEEKQSSGACEGCGDGGSRRALSRRLVAPTNYNTETFGNENVQQNIVNVFGDVDLGESEQEPESYVRPVRSESPSPGMRAFYAACTAVMWISATIMGLVLAFFVVVFIKAFILRGL
jgi:hypothetical protein